jgi:hypothetical protein
MCRRWLATAARVHVARSVVAPDRQTMKAGIGVVSGPQAKPGLGAASPSSRLLPRRVRSAP